MNYKDAYSHIMQVLDGLIARLEQPRADCTPGETAALLRSAQAEGEKIRISPSPNLTHRAPRSGSSGW